MTQRPLLIAVEGCGGTGKTTLLDALLVALGEDAAIIKRPIPGGTAEALLRWDADTRASHDEEGSVHGLPTWHDDLIAALAHDCADALRLARTSPQPIRILSRHWISTATNQHRDWRAEARRQRDLWGEPDLWVICDARWEVVEERLHARALANPNRTPCPGSDLDHATPPDVIAAHLVRYHWIARHVLCAPVVIVTPESVSLRSDGRLHYAPTSTRAAEVIAAHIRYMMECDK